MCSPSCGAMTTECRSFPPAAFRHLFSGWFDEKDLDMVPALESENSGLSVIGADGVKYVCWAGDELRRSFQEDPVSTVGAIAAATAVVFSFGAHFWIHFPLTAAYFSPNVLAIHSASVMACFALRQVWRTDPGRIPDEWLEESTEDLFVVCDGSHGELVVKRQRGIDGLRFCSKEHRVKPDRAHYCHELERNVLRMDHYCPLLCDCVGFFNHKHFYLFLGYSLVALLGLDVDLASAVVQAGSISISSGAALGLLFGASTTITTALTVFFSFHTLLLARNVTSLEFYSALSRGSDSLLLVLQRNAYDVGPLRNLKCVLGDEIYLWPLPIAGPSGDGIVWEVSLENLEVQAAVRRCEIGPPGCSLRICFPCLGLPCDRPQQLRLLDEGCAAAASSGGTFNPKADSGGTL